jgi:hypothetical protein
MAIQSSKKNDVNILDESKKIRPTIVRTQNVVKEMLKVAKTNNVPVSSLDFTILEVETFIRMNQNEWEKISPDALNSYNNKDKLLDPELEIKQTYEIEIFSKDAEEDLYPNFNLAIGANKTRSKIFLSIKAGSEVQYNPNFENDLLTMINKDKIRAGVLINIFDNMIPDVISKIAAHIRVQGKAVYTKNDTYLIAQGFEPTASINDYLVKHYEKKEETNENDQIDYSDRGFIQSVCTGDLILEYFKAKLGVPGRNCRGEYIKTLEPISKNEPTFSVDDKIKVIETDTSTKYEARANGYVTLENNVYTIKTDVQVDQISFKTTGSITTGLGADVSINVKETDSAKDAIGDGMVVEVNEISVAGNVGPNAVLTATKATIEGQTHQSSIITATDLNINVHKGKAFGDNIKITRLENGIVDGNNIVISQALGGMINGKKINIEICASHVKATATRYIEIKKLQGEENIFTIDPSIIKEGETNSGNNKNEPQELEIKIKSLTKEVEKYKKLIEENTASFNDVKKRLMNYKKKGIKMPQAFVKRYKEFQEMQEHFNTLSKEKEQKEQKYTLLTTRSASYQESITDARIINRDRWVGYNEIIFKLINPPVLLKYLPPAGSSGKIFGVVEVGEDEYKIQEVEE